MCVTNTLSMVSVHFQHQLQVKFGFIYGATNVEKMKATTVLHCDDNMGFQ
jgi:hypothetical protein